MRIDWNDLAGRLVGRRIIGANYTSSIEQEAMGWVGSNLLLELDDGTLICASADEDRTAPGAILTFHSPHDQLPRVFPVLIG